MASNEELLSDIDNKLKTSCPNVQLKEVPAINQKRLVAFINHFTINMVDYLNKFAQTCQQRLFLCDEKLRRMEDELSLLEAKLNSIPEAQGVDVPPEPPSQNTPMQITKEQHEPRMIPETETVAKMNNSDEMSSSTTDGASVSKSDDGSTSETSSVDISKYLKMAQVGVPLLAVKAKMQQEGVDPHLLDKR